MKKSLTSLDRVRIRRTKFNSSALVIVLCFVVLLTVVVLALFSRSIFNGLVSNASANVTKTDLYAHGAINQILGDLEQEVVDGSAATSTSGGNLYRPNSTTNMVVYNSGPSTYAGPAAAGITTVAATTIWNTMPNLVKESCNGVAFYPNGSGYNAAGLTRAAAVSTTSMAVDGSTRIAPNSSDGISRNGRYVSVARWNKPLLLPKALATITTGTTTGTTISDSGTTATAVMQPTPLSAFVAPDWILTAADGSNVITSTLDTSPSVTTSNVNPKSPKYVIGRYAYTIYNEGGLLDANVAGCPPGSSALQQALISRKGPTAFADLTQLPGIADIDTIESSTTRSPAIVSSLVGWRNTATAQITYTTLFPNYTFTSAQITNYLNYLLGFSTNFMSVGNTSLYTGLSDRVFTTRQQMINFFTNTVATSTTEQAYLQDAMMYLGTSSRTLNQPSYWPDPNRPKVLSLGYPANGTGTYPAPGNDAYNQDNSYNPVFRSIRVTTGFTRSDGTTAAVGEPLVKKRFALSRLAWISYEGPLSTLSSTDALFTQYTNLGIPTSLVTQWTTEGTAANIKNYFGLTWNANPYSSTTTAPQLGGYWVYDPDGDLHTATTMIKTLSQVAAKNREPNFFELLKAAICVGSIARGGPNGLEEQGPTPDYTYRLYRDSQVDYQIFQIGANIISQASPANYPTQIVAYNSNAAISANQSFFGVVDLPYLCQTGNLYIVNAQSSPSYPSSTASTGPPTTGSVSNPGKVVMLQSPIVWNPHTPGASAYLAGLTPTKLRIGVSDTVPPFIGTSAGYYQVQAAYQYTILTTGTNTVTTTDNYPAPFKTLYPPWGNTAGGYPTGPFPTAGTWTQSNTGAGYGTNVSSINQVSTSSTYATATGLVDFSAVGSKPNTEIYFDGDPTGNTTLFREPTPLLYSTGIDSGTGTFPSGTYLDSNNILETVGGFSTAYVTDVLNTTTSPAPQYLGFFMGEFPLCWNDSSTPNTIDSFDHEQGYNVSFYGSYYSLEYQVGAGSSAVWVPYQQNDLFGEQHSTTPTATYVGAVSTTVANGFTSEGGGTAVWDPRTGHWGDSNNIYPGTPLQNYAAGNNPPVTLQTIRTGSATGVNADGYFYGSSAGKDQYFNKLQAFSPDFTNMGTYIVDADGVLRPPMGAYVLPIANPTATSAVGLPMATVYSGNPTTTALSQVSSRPIILHRPFRSVAELGYVFSDTPWRNIDFFTPESGDSALLDTFCINEDYRPDAVTAGRVDLNTRQAPVIQALLNGAYRDELNPTTGTLAQSEAIAISQALVQRTTGVTKVINVTGTSTTPTGPLSNIADLVGRYTSTAVANPNNGTALTSTNPTIIGEPYDGFSVDLVGNPTPGTSPLYSSGTASNIVVQRFLESTMRGLSDAGQAGTWNLLIDVVAQSGRYPANAGGLSDFLVEGERRFWVHVAIDRQTGQVIDENIEAVNE
jgi:hypothetical protein